MTSSFYDDNAETYAARDRQLPTMRLDAFLENVSPAGKVLELGCGAGQDSAHMLAKGFDVTPTDGSPELALQAEKRLRRPVTVLRFQDLEAESEFDGIWAEASLLHVPRAELPGVLSRIRRALKPGAPLHASFKAGNAEGHDSLGRYYNYPSAEWLTELLVVCGWWDISIREADGGGYDNLPTRWLYAIARK